MLIVSGCENNGKTEYDTSTQKMPITTIAPLETPIPMDDSQTEAEGIGWDRKSISVLESFGQAWGSSLVENSKYYFYITNGSIKRISKKTNKEIIIAENAGIFFLDKKQIYYVHENTGEVISIDFSGAKSKKIVNSKVLKAYGAVMENPAILGIHVQNDDLYLLLSAFEVVHYNAQEKQLEQIAFDARKGCFLNDSFYYLDRASDSIYSIDLKNKRKSVVTTDKKEGVYHDLFVFRNSLYYVKDETIYKLLKNKRDMVFRELTDGQEFIEYVPSERAISYVYWEKEQVYICWRDGKKNWEHMILPENFYAAGGLIDGIFFYEAVDLQDEDEEVLPNYDFIRVTKDGEE